MEANNSSQAKISLKTSVSLTIFVLFITLILVIGYWAFWANISPAWTGFGSYNEELNGPRSKTLWDWMELLLVPVGLALAGYWFTKVQKTTELEIALKNQRQQSLESYLDRIKELILVRGLGPNAYPEVNKLATTLTLNILRELNEERNRQVVQFLQESELLETRWRGVIKLSKADLSNIDLNGANLLKVNLFKAILCDANLSGANLNNADLRETKLERANLRKAKLYLAVMEHAKLAGADLREANLRDVDLTFAKLPNANLRYAILRRAKLPKTDLSAAKLKGADLSHANLFNANLEQANLFKANLKHANLTQANLFKTNLSRAIYNNKTRWPDDFDPVAAGAIRDEA